MTSPNKGLKSGDYVPGDLWPLIDVEMSVQVEFTCEPLARDTHART